MNQLKRAWAKGIVERPVFGGLEEWYAGFRGRPKIQCKKPKAKVKHRRVYLSAAERKKLPRCVACNRNAVSQGNNRESRCAAEQNLCMTCYKVIRPSRKQLMQERIKKHGACIKCGDRMIAGGKSKTAIHARKKKMCVDCCTGTRGRGEID